MQALNQSKAQRRGLISLLSLVFDKVLSGRMFVCLALAAQIMTGLVQTFACPSGHFSCRMRSTLAPRG